jgi:hypothetical protein
MAGFGGGLCGDCASQWTLDIGLWTLDV